MQGGSGTTGRHKHTHCCSQMSRVDGLSCSVEVIEEGGRRRENEREEKGEKRKGRRVGEGVEEKGGREAERVLQTAKCHSCNRDTEMHCYQRQ